MNLAHLANHLGMSKTTVSRALNGYPEVNVRTRERVLKAAKEVGYQPNPMARSLALGRTNIFGIIHPLQPTDMADPMFLEVVAGMSSALEALGKNLIIAPVSPAAEQPSYQQIVSGRRVDGLVVGRTLVRDERIAFLSKAKFPFVAHGRTELNAPYAWFDYDNEAGMRLALERLLGVGHRRVALISAPLALNFACQRRDSFEDTMAAAGLGVDPRYLINNTLDRRSGYQAMQELLACSPRPTAVIVDNHLSGVGAVRALLDAGVKVGEEISVIVWGSMADTLSSANVTSIDLPNPRQAGARMIAMLLALVGGKPASELQELWQPVLVEGATVGPA
ncbi:substrate-binding domain-containing protein [Duganella sp. FT135W]|uniref:Substrate-binding domain-containing protein n=1 Tax=Duganella flavida TaxID=2692175 RepID=A0A6L8K6C7_9BURK|nr:substrate-binding domain-containing protein [Duganella flavida]MYM23069.1 substrate-binding domain-containing protein [Duganella flavida]